MADQLVETRTVTSKLEYREDDAAAPVLEGYAATFNRWYRVGGFDEMLQRSAFDRTLLGNPDVQLLINHEGEPLARTKSGTLELSTDDHGLKVRASLDASDPDVQRLLPKLRRGDMDEMSFAFRVPRGGDTWDYAGDVPKRSIREAVLHQGDVSVVNNGANEDTEVDVRARDEQGAALTLAYAMLSEARSGHKFEPRQTRRLADSLATLGVNMAPGEHRTVGDSFNDTQSALRDALQKAFGGDDGDEPCDLWVQDAGPDWVVWTAYGDAGPGVGTWRDEYSLDGLTVTLAGSPVKVTVETTYQPATEQNSAGDTTETPEDASGYSIDHVQRVLRARQLRRPA